jgi:signal transduction histidine kinase
MMRSRFQFGAARPERGLWLAAALMLAAVLVPTGCLVYFMNEAVEKERALAGRELNEAYTAELQAVAAQVERYWADRAEALDGRNLDQAPGVHFEHCVLDGLADSVIVLKPDGTPAYPSLPATPAADATLRRPEWAEARAMEDSGKPEEAAQRYAAIYRAEKDPNSSARAAQASVRCLLAAGKRTEAVQAVSRYFGTLDLVYATSLDGRLIRPDELLVAIQLQPGGSAGAWATQRLFGAVQNYAVPMPSAQRLFLMNQLRALDIAARLRTFPTYRAERLAERILTEGHIDVEDHNGVDANAAGKEGRIGLSSRGLQQSGLATVWAITSPRRRTVGFYEQATVRKIMANFTNGLRGYRITGPDQAPPPGGSVSAELGAMLPGWRISMADRGDPAALRLASQRRIASYLWIAFLAVTLVALLAGVVAQVLRRQMRIAHLKADLVAAVSHELKTPLASMKLLVESLLSGETLDPVRTRHYLQLVARENNRLSRLIDNFLTFSRMERNRSKFEFSRVRPEAVVRTVMESIGERFPVQVSMAADLPMLYADEDALVTVLLNLLENSYKYTGEDRRIRLNVTRANGQVTFAVEDNGIGIPEREQKRIFRRFYQVDRRLARDAGGVGLGLTIVNFIVAAHHGTVTVQSHPGAGSTFTVSMPPSVSAAEAAV